MHALSSAALAMAVTRACTRGELEKCGCDRKVRGVSPEGECGLSCMDGSINEHADLDGGFFGQQISLTIQEKEVLSGAFGV